MSTPSMTPQPNVQFNRSLSSGGAYSETLDQLLGFGTDARPPVAGLRRLPEMNSSGTPPTRNGSGSSAFAERPTTRHGNRSSSSNATSSSSSGKRRETAYAQQLVENFEVNIVKSAPLQPYATTKKQRPVLSPVQSSNTSLNIWSREEDNNEEKKFPADSHKTTSIQSGDEDEVDEFTKKLQNLANRRMQARNNLENSSQSLLLTKKPSVIIEKGEGSQASSSISLSTSSSPSRKLNGKSAQNNEIDQEVTDNSEKRMRRSSAFLSDNIDKETLTEPKIVGKNLIQTANHGALFSVHRLSQPKIRSSSANVTKEKKTSNCKPWGSNINGKESSKKRSSFRPISTTVASLSGFPSQLEGSGTAMSTTSSSYDAWLKHKIDEDKKKKMALKVKQEEEERKKKEKKIDAEKSFQRWKEERDKKISEQRVKEKKKQKQQLEKERLAKEEKRANAQKTFEYWQKSQLEQLRRHKSQSALETKKKINQKSREEEVKKKEAECAYREWLHSHVKKISTKAQKVTEAEKEQKEMIKKEKEYREGLAQEAYRLWLEMKREEENYAHSLAYKILEYESEAKKKWPSTPWLPNGNTVPRRFIGHGNRRRTIEKPLLLKYSAKRTQSVH